MTVDILRPQASPSREDAIPADYGIPRVKVLGLGGGGTNAVNRMIELGLHGIEFIAANTDCQALSSALAPTRLQLGPRLTRGLGAGGDPRVGEAAALESNREIADALQGADIVFVTAGMGGGTGTGAAPIAAEIAREKGAVVIAIVTMPFSFEMGQRAKNALEGVRKLRPHTHTLITVPNDRLLEVAPRGLSLEVAFRLADDILRQGIQGMAELLTKPGLINVDYAHVRRMMLRGGGALMSIGLGEGVHKASAAVHQALHHPLLQIDTWDQASGVLAHFTGGDDLSLHEIGEAVDELRSALAPDVDLILGASTDELMTGKAQAILIITGIGARPAGSTRSASLKKALAPEISLSAAQIDDLDLPAFMRRRVAAG
jgi:cell division protein FtsZ